MLAKLYILWIYSKPNQCTLYNCAGHASILCHCTGKYNLIVSAGITAVAMYISSAAEVLVYMCRSGGLQLQTICCHFSIQLPFYNRCILNYVF